MARDGWLNAENIQKFLDEVDRELGHGRDRVEMYIAGGARMILGLRDNRATSDIDGLIEAIDRFIDQKSRGRRQAILREAAGVWRDRTDLPDVDALRRGWDRD